jgi:transcriptional regulator with XRE-family HTH domain
MESFLARLTYNLPTEELRELLMLSHLSLSEISRRFGLSRSNLMGLLRGLRTVGDEKLAALLVWAGLEVDAAASLHLGPGVHLWQITSIRQMEALDHLPESVLPGTLKFDMVIELPHIDRSWVHLMSHSVDHRHILLSCRPAFFLLLQDRKPCVGQPERLVRFTEQKTHAGLVSDMGQQTLHMPHQHIPEVFTWMEPEQIEAHPEIDDWAQWVRQKLRIDTSAWVTPDMAGKESAAAQKCADDFDSALRQPDTLSPFSEETCNHTRKLLTHRLDVGGGYHRDVCDIPVFPLQGHHEYPTGMVRLDVHFLGEALLQLGKAKQLRLYSDPPGGIQWLVAVASETTCGLPMPPGKASGTNLRLVLRRRHLVITDSLTQNDQWLGDVIGRCEMFPPDNLAH